MAHNINVGNYVVGVRGGLCVEGTVTHIRPDIDDAILIKAYFAGGSYRDEKGEYALLSLTPDQITTVYGETNDNQS